MSRRAYAARSNLVKEGDREEYAVALITGMGCRYKDLVNGKRQLVALLLPGDFCDAESHLLRAADHGVEMLTEGVVAHVPRRLLARWRLESPALKKAMDWSALVEIAVTREWIVNLGARRALARTAHLICEMKDRLASVDISLDSMRSPTQGDLANALGLTPVHMSRVLSHLRKTRVIELESKRLTILDVEALQALAGFDPAYLHPAIRAE